MQFYVGEGESGRYANAIQFVDHAGVASAASCIDAQGDVDGLTVTRDGRKEHVDTIEEAAQLVAVLLADHRDNSLVVLPGSARSTPNSFETTGEVHPPRRHPRLRLWP